MRKMSKYVRIVVTLILALSMVLGSYVGVFALPTPQSPSILETSIDLLVGDNQKVTAQNSSGWNINYSSNATGVATVNPNGKVNAVSQGTATITATFTKSGRPTVVDTCTVNVYNKPTITKTLTLYKNESGQIQVTDGAGWNVVWSAPASDKVSVTSSGLVTGLKASNNVNVKATFTRGSKNVECICKVTVIELAMNTSSLSIYVGDNYQLDVSNDDTWTTTWTTGDESVVVVDDSGYITGLYPGTATVTATSTKAGYGTVVNSCLVTVRERSSYDHVDADKVGYVNYIINKNDVNQSTTLLDAVVSDFAVTVNGETFNSFSFGSEYRVNGKWRIFIIFPYWDDLEVHTTDEITLSANLNIVVDGNSIAVPYSKTLTRDELIAAVLLCPQHTGFDFILLGDYVVNTYSYNVDFVDYNDASLGTVSDVESGTAILESSVPSDPTRAENNDGLGTRTTYEFLGWDDADTLDVELYSATEVASVIVTSDKNFNAVYDATNYYMMYFYSEDGGTLLTQIEIKEGDPMVYPTEVPEKEDEVRADGKYYFTFAGWVPFEISYLTSVAPVVEGVSGSETLKAVFVENKYITVNFYAQLPNGTRVLVETQYLMPGEDAVDPSAEWMTNNNYILGDWNGVLTGIEEDTDLTARAANVAGAVETNTDTNTDRQPVVAGATEVQTGDNTPVVSMSLLLIAAAFSIVFIVSRRRKNA